MPEVSRPFSRDMPALPEAPVRDSDYMIVGLFLSGLVLWGAIANPLLTLIIVVFIPLIYLAGPTVDRRLLGLAAERPDDSICTFARAFDRRTMDAWIVRATWDEIRSYLPEFEGRPFPLRATDRLWDDLHLEADDMEYAIVTNIVQRSGRRFRTETTDDDTQPITTVGDLVRWIHTLPALD